jgi:hypothetical protein
LDRHRGSERDILQRDKEEKQRGRSEDAAKKKQRAIRTSPVSPSPTESEYAKGGRDRRAEKHNFHRRDMRHLFYENVGKRKGERRYEHRTHAFGQKSIFAAQWAVLEILAFEEQPQSVPQSAFVENARVFFHSIEPANAKAPNIRSAASKF